MADEPREQRPSPRPGSASPEDLAARLADVHRRTEELAARVAEFQAETEQLVAEVEPGGGAERISDAAATADGAERISDAEADGSGGGAERISDAEADGSGGGAERRHRPRPSLSAPLVYDAEGPAGQPASADTGNGAAPPEEPEKPAARPAEPEREPEKKTKKKRGVPGWVRRLRTLVVVVVVAIAAALALRSWVVAPYYVPSASMEPTLHGCPGCNDDHLLVEKLSYDFHDPKRGDIVVFSNPGKRWGQAHDKTLIKRVVGVPGDRLVIRDRHVFVNGARLNEPYVNKACRGTLPGEQGRSVRVPKGDLWVMGDNRCDSEDSRMFGPVPISDVIGRAFLIIWPLSRFGPP